MRVSMPLVAAATLLAILIAIYGPGIGKGFVKDDVVWVGANHVTSWSDVRTLLFRTDGFYRPVVAATFALDRAVYGLAPFGFGVTNLILLLLGGCALAYLATSLGLRATSAIVVAGVWSLNFHAVNMANNHAMDFGAEGLLDSLGGRARRPEIGPAHDCGHAVRLRGIRGRLVARRLPDDDERRRVE